MTSFYEAEVDKRIASAWGAFGKYSAELRNKKIALKTRVRLFDAVVTPCATYASACWALRSSEVSKMQAARRSMLRAIVGVKRQCDEDWVCYVRRSTHTSERLFSENGSEDWVSIHRRRKWRFAAKLATANDARW